MVKSLILLIFVPIIAFSQQEKAESNNDLRFGKKIFIYKDLVDSKEYIFSKKSNGESYLTAQNFGTAKLSNLEESEFEPMVVNLFIKIKYQLAEYNQPCSEKSFLNYLGDETTICKKDRLRNDLVIEIKKRFENLMNKSKR